MPVPRGQPMGSEKPPWKVPARTAQRSAVVFCSAPVDASIPLVLPSACRGEGQATRRTGAACCLSVSRPAARTGERRRATGICLRDAWARARKKNEARRIDRRETEPPPLSVPLWRVDPGGWLGLYISRNEKQHAQPESRGTAFTPDIESQAGTPCLGSPWPVGKGRDRRQRW